MFQSNPLNFIDGEAVTQRRERLCLLSRNGWRTEWMEDEESNTLTLVLVALQNNELEFYLLLSLPPPYCLLPVTGF